MKQHKIKPSFFEPLSAIRENCRGRKIVADGDSRSRVGDHLKKKGLLLNTGKK